MNKTAIIALAVLGLFLIAGCTGVTSSQQQTSATTGNSATADPVQEVSNNLVDSNNSVQIGEMV